MDNLNTTSAIAINAGAARFTEAGLIERFKNLETAWIGYTALMVMASMRGSSIPAMETKVFGTERPSENWRKSRQLADVIFHIFDMETTVATLALTVEPAMKLVSSRIRSHMTSLGVSSFHEYKKVGKYTAQSLAAAREQAAVDAKEAEDARLAAEAEDARLAAEAATAAEGQAATEQAATEAEAERAEQAEDLANVKAEAEGTVAATHEAAPLELARKPVPASAVAADTRRERVQAIKAAIMLVSDLGDLAELGAFLLERQKVMAVAAAKVAKG